MAEDIHLGDSRGKSSLDIASSTDESADWSSSVSEEYNVEGVWNTETEYGMSEGKFALETG